MERISRQSSIRPGQTTPNELEVTILEHFTSKLPGLLAVVPRLHVLSREFTGVGSYTNFKPAPVLEAPTRFLVLKRLIAIPGIKHGLVAILFFKEGKIDFLEIVTAGDELWDGVFDGFSISEDENSEYSGHIAAHTKSG
ncbi:MAG: hypothetical protein ABSB42_04120 [Tepidisphaeraceae bacterium]|jgi:hypothetical protein